MIPVSGEVRLTDKQSPVCGRAEFDEQYAYLRATVDTSAFKAKLLSLPSTAWDDAHQEGNARITRPAHDAWGIRKIVFVFCDDFLLKVLDLPWSKLDDWREHLLPIYHSIGVDESKVVRCLLASMPPGMSIPVHHDTGYWVKHTHRVHVPIITDSKLVHFNVGPTEDRMAKVLFEEGSVIELNNQAKHAVVNGSALWRVHLIFDYVESHPITRLSVLPGEKIFQTRRSVDLERESGSRRMPSFIVLGAQKSGTTSLHAYLCQHPLVVPGKRRETHYFDWRWNNSATTAEEHLKSYMEYFPEEALRKMPSLVTGESTPSYLLHAHLVIPRIRLTCPWVQLLVVLRNPVERAYSQYQMCVSQDGTEEQRRIRGMSVYIGRSFAEVVEKEMAQLVDAGMHENSSDEAVDEFVSKLPMGHGGHSIVLRGCYCLQLSRWMEAFPSEQLRVMSMDEIRGDRLKVVSAMEQVFEFVGLPPHEIEDVEPRNTRTYAPMDALTRSKLEAFYQPYNARLFQLLRREFEAW